MERMKHPNDHEMRVRLGLIGKRPWSRYVLGRCEARNNFAKGTPFVVNVMPVESSYCGSTRFMMQAQRPNYSTLYRVRVWPKGIHRFTPRGVHYEPFIVS